nr:MAG TPA: hypothetical protein [Caudoviricetes sp.]
MRPGSLAARLTIHFGSFEGIIGDFGRHFGAFHCDFL